jgi:hypothetical protein
MNPKYNVGAFNLEKREFVFLEERSPVRKTSFHSIKIEEGN